MIQKILTYAYIILGFTSFCYWVSAVISVFHILKHRKPGLSYFKVATTGVFNEDNFTSEGKTERVKLQSTMLKFGAVVLGMVLVVFVGVQTQS
jgi:hypothetical protein